MCSVLQPFAPANRRTVLCTVAVISYAAGSSIDTSKARELTATSRPSGRSQLLNLDITPIGRQTANKGRTQHVSMRPIASNLVCNQSSIPHKFVWQTTIRPNHIPGLVLNPIKQLCRPKFWIARRLQHQLYSLLCGSQYPRLYPSFLNTFSKRGASRKFLILYIFLMLVS